MKDFRNEHKYIASEEVLYIIEQRVKCLMQKDSHVAQNGFYSIKSLLARFFNLECICLE